MVIMNRIFFNTEFQRGFTQADEVFDIPFQGHPNIIFCGRSNVGKSSLLNALFSNKIARVSNTPGRTQQINYFKSEIMKDEVPTAINVFDLPGYGFAKVSKAQKKTWNELMEQFFRDMPINSIVVLIQDARHPNQKSDQDFLDWIQTVSFDVGVLIFNKYDKLKKQSDRALLKKNINEISKKYSRFGQFFSVSATQKTGLDPFHDFLQSLF